MIHWVTANDHVGSRTHSGAWRPNLGPLNSRTSRASRVQRGGVCWPQEEDKQCDLANRMLSWHGRCKETADDYNDSDSGLRQQHILNEAQWPRRFGIEIHEDGHLVDLEAASIETGIRFLNPQGDTSRPEATANEDETRSVENLRPLPLVCRRTGMSPSI